MSVPTLYVHDVGMNEPPYLSFQRLVDSIIAARIILHARSIVAEDRVFNGVSFEFSVMLTMDITPGMSFLGQSSPRLRRTGINHEFVVDLSQWSQSSSESVSKQ